MSAPASPASIQMRRFHPWAGAPSADVDETAAVPISLGQAHASTSATLTARSSGLEQPQEMAKASADQIAALRRQLEEQQVVSASFEERLGRLETAGKVAAAAEVAVAFPPDAREARVDQPEAVADANPDATVCSAGMAEPVRACKLAESMWDSPLFLGRPEVGMGRVVTLWAVLVLLLNIFLQITIAVIVVDKMSDPRFVARTIEDLWYASEPRFVAP